ncbi:MAG: group III truncated hemoglobin [Flavobacteriales bacterium]|nr:group III truncated hemoglobin [Flavobacteriales bacterium]
MKHDIRTAEDIDQLVRSFYQRSRPDALIGHFFTHLDWDLHIPRIVSFWRMVLLGDREYQGDPMTAHVQLAREQPLSKAHFERWLLHWDAAADGLFAGPKADEAKQRARTIAAVMAHKVGAL